jgi:hypothetical protein
MTIIPKEQRRESILLTVFFWTLLGVFCDKITDTVFATLIGTAFTFYVGGRAYTEKGKSVSDNNQK